VLPCKTSVQAIRAPASRHQAASLSSVPAPLARRVSQSVLQTSLKDAVRGAQVDRYKQLLLKQRDIMIALTARLNERDEQILTLQEELEAYDVHQKCDVCLCVARSPVYPCHP